MILFSCFVMFYFGIKMLLVNKTHILMILMILEFLYLVLFLMLTNILSIYGFDFNVVVYFLVFVVCEAVLGLILLTLIIRSHGTDYLKSINLLGC